eukprot:scaffold1036_cov169-Ochromonas_danica.AAC.28
MVFDFLRKRSEEGLAQVKNLAEKTLEGKLGEALEESAQYLRTRSSIDRDNLKKLMTGLASSRDRLLAGISAAFQGSSEDVSLEQRLERLEETLLQADIGYSTTQTILEDLRQYAKTESLQEEDITPVMRERLIEALTASHPDLSLKRSEAKPTVLLIMGANGMGKTTTIGKIAHRLRNEGNSTVLLAACDTFRAAAVEQLHEWANRANVSIEQPLASERGGSPLPVLERSLKRAQEENFDILIVDTSGKLSNNFHAIDMFQQMKAKIDEAIPGAPHETILVVDGSLGRNAVDQARSWSQHVGVTALAVTKMDGTARAGFVVSVVKDLGLPVKLIGVGEKIDDLRDFQPEQFVDALLGVTEEKVSLLRQRAAQLIQRRVGPKGPTAKQPAKDSKDMQSRLMASFDPSYDVSKASAKTRKPRPKPTNNKKKNKK